MSQAHQHQKSMTLAEQMNVFFGCAQIIAMPFFAVLRVPGLCGEAVFGVRAIMGLIFQFFFLGYQGDPIAIPAFWVTAAAFILHRVFGVFRRHPNTPSLFVGISNLRCRLWSDRFAIRTVEPLVLFVVAFLSLGFSGALAAYLFIGGNALLIVQAHCEMQTNHALRAMRDMQSEQAYLYSEYQRKFGRR